MEKLEDNLEVATHISFDEFTDIRLLLYIHAKIGVVQDLGFQC